MSAVTDALEREVAAIRDLRAGETDDAATSRAIDRHFGRIMHLVAPRVRHFTRAYGLTDMADDAQQACAIGVYRAICDYDPERARFTTFVNWQLRCELQALRYRVRLDSRDSAKRVSARTVSLDALTAEAEDRQPLQVEDEAGVDRVEAELADRLARESFEAMLADYEEAMRERTRREIEREAERLRETMPGTVHPDAMDTLEADLAMERGIVTRYVFAESEKAKFDPDHPLDRDKQRQISRRVLRNIRARLPEGLLN